MLGKRLTQAMRDAGIDRRELARLSGVAYSTIAGIESGAQKRTTALVALASTLGVTPEWLQTGKGDKYAQAKTAAQSHTVQLDLGTLIRAVKFMQRMAAMHGATFDPLRDADLLVNAYEIESQESVPTQSDNLLDFGDALRKRMANRGGRSDENAAGKTGG